MAEVSPSSERKPRKSVAFADGQTIVDENGQVTESNQDLGRTNSAEQHSLPSNGDGSGDAAVDKQTEEMEQMFAGLTTKKKKKSSVKKEEGDAIPSSAVADGDEAAPAATAEDPDGLDLLALKKKKKKKVKAPDEDFEAKLAEAGETDTPAATNGADADAAASTTGLQDGDPIRGTGVWSHASPAPINYASLLSRFFTLLHDSHPDLASAGGKSYKIPPPQCLREGNKKTIFANIAEICKRMKRTDEHVTQFLFAELGTSGSVDGSRRLVIKGRFQQKQIENVLRRYIVEYVSCKTCRSMDTELNKGENRLYFVTCNSCGSRRSVTAIKTGFSAQVGKRKRQQG